MRRYGSKLWDDLYEEIVARYEDSHLTLTMFVTLLLRLIVDFIEAHEWPKD